MISKWRLTKISDLLCIDTWHILINVLKLKVLIRYDRIGKVKCCHFLIHSRAFIEMSHFPTHQLTSCKVFVSVTKQAFIWIHLLGSRPYGKAFSLGLLFLSVGHKIKRQRGCYLESVKPMHVRRRVFVLKPTLNY